LDRGPRTLELGNGAPGRMFDASLERLSVTETSYNNSLAERVTRSTIQTLPATLPEPRSKARGPRSVIKETAGARAAIGDSRSEFVRIWTTDRGWCVADRGPWAGFLGNGSRSRVIKLMRTLRSARTTVQGFAYVQKSKAARSGQEDLRSCGFRSARSFDDQLADYA